MNYIYDPTSILDYITQPVLFVREGRILHTNKAAAAYVEDLTDSIDTLMSYENVEAYHQFDGISTMEVVLTLGGYQYGATIHRQEEWDVFVAYTTPLGQGHQASIMALTGQTMRGALVDILNASMALFPYLEEMENPEIQNNTAQINRGIYQLLRLAGNLADGSLFLTQSRAICIRKMDLQSYFEEMFEKIGSYCGEKHIQFEPTLNLRIGYGNIDEQLLQRAILNLISNALKFTPSGGKIRMLVEAQGEKLKIEVEDNGEGISEQVLGSVYERYTARPQVGDGRWGVGLGLPMVRYIMKAHNGDMRITSQKGEGTLVTLTMSLTKTVSPMSLHSPTTRYDGTNGIDPYAKELVDIALVDRYKGQSLY